MEIHFQLYRNVSPSPSCKNLSSYPPAEPQCYELESTAPKLPWYRKPLIVQIIAPILIVLAVGAGIGVTGVGVSQLLGGDNVFAATVSHSPAPSSLTARVLNAS